MISYKCDKCAKEIEGIGITGDTSCTLSSLGTQFEIALGSEKYKDLCKDCIIDLINESDDRPKARDMSHEYDKIMRGLVNITRDNVGHQEIGQSLVQFMDDNQYLFGSYMNPF